MIPIKVVPGLVARLSGARSPNQKSAHRICTRKHVKKAPKVERGCAVSTDNSSQMIDGHKPRDAGVHEGILLNWVPHCLPLQQSRWAEGP